MTLPALLAIALAHARATSLGTERAGAHAAPRADRSALADASSHARSARRGATAAVRLAATALLAAGIGLALPALAQDEVLDVAGAAQLLRLPPAKIEQLARSGRLPGRDIDGQWRFSRRALLDWVGAPRVPPGSAADGVMPAAELAATIGRQQPAGSSATVGERPASPSAEAIALRDQGGLLRAGTGSVEVGASYTRTEQSLGLLRLERSTTTSTGVLRFVPFDGVQFSARMPYAWQRLTVFEAVPGGNPSVTKERADGRGDATVSVLAQLARERGGVPNLLVGLDGVIATDQARSSGVGASVLLTKSADPAVLLLGLSYLRALDDDKLDQRSGLARNNYGLNLGYIYALNDTVAVNTLFAGSWRAYRAEAPAALAGTLPPSREAYALQFGATWLIARGLYIEPAIAVRVGGERPDLTFSISMPWTF